jgi:hypothetical protein
MSRLVLSMPALECAKEGCKRCNTDRKGSHCWIFPCARGPLTQGRCQWPLCGQTSRSRSLHHEPSPAICETIGSFIANLRQSVSKVHKSPSLVKSASSMSKLTALLRSGFCEANRNVAFGSMNCRMSHAEPQRSRIDDFAMKTFRFFVGSSTLLEGRYGVALCAQSRIVQHPATRADRFRRQKGPRSSRRELRKSGPALPCLTISFYSAR